MKLTKDQRKIFYNIFFPALAENLLLQLFHIADSVMLGQMPDSTVAVGAVGLCGAPTNLIIATTGGFFIGVTATIAWLFGAKKPDRLKSVTLTAGLIAFVVASLFSSVAIFGAEGIIGFICKKSEVYDTALRYFKITAYGHFFQIMTSFITASFRGIGITKMPLLYNLSGAVVNVVLNYMMIYGKCGFPIMREAGAAWATTISKIVIFIIALSIFLFKDTPIRPAKGSRLKWDPIIKSRLLPIGITALIEQIIAQSGATIGGKIVGSLPTEAIAVNQIAVQSENFAWATGGACQIASTSLFGRCMGENNEPKARAYLRLILKCAAICGGASALFFLFFGRQFASLFTNNAALYPLAAKILILSGISLIFINLHQVLSGALRGAGDSVAPLISSMSSLWIFRVGGGILTVWVLGFGLWGYRWSAFADQAMRLVPLALFYLTNHWKKHHRGINKKNMPKSQ